MMTLFYEIIYKEIKVYEDNMMAKSNEEEDHI
jgi:hypothetical protein